jgi:hypothetical protein
MSSKKASKQRRFPRNTPEREARIQAGIAQDPDAHEVMPAQAKRMRPLKDILAERRCGRPKAEVTKEPVTVRPDPEGRRILP